MRAQFRTATAFGIVRRHDVRPQHPRRAQFGDLHEIVGADREVELDRRSYPVHVASQVGEPHDVFVPHGQRESQLLHDRRPAIVEQRPVHGDQPHAFVLRRFFEQFFDTGELLGPVGSRTAPGTFFREFHEGVDSEDGEHLFGIEFFGNDLVEEQFGGSVNSAAAESEFDGRDRDPFQQGVEVGGRKVLTFDDETERIDAFHQDVVRLRIRGFDVFADFDGLSHAPVVVGFDATHVRKGSGNRAEVPEPRHVFGPVIRLCAEPFQGTPYQFLGTVGPLEVFGNGLFPLPGGNGRKFGHQLLSFFFCHR